MNLLSLRDQLLQSISRDSIMKLFLLVVLFATVAVIEGVKPNPSFLRYVGSYHFNTPEAGVGVKNYFLSQRVTYNWVDSYMYCKSVGLHIATVNTPVEMKNLANIANGEPTLFKDAVYIDGKTSEKSDKCLSILKRSKGRFEIRRVECHNKRERFLCEEVELAAQALTESKTQESPLSSRMNIADLDDDERVDVRETFFRELGTFRSTDVTKTYYLSDVSAPIFDAMKVCQSFDMTLASPKNQDEFDRLRSLLREDRSWDGLSMAGYRSEEFFRQWNDASGELNYNVVWNSGEPNNAGGRENCMMWLKSSSPTPSINDFDCPAPMKFICEYLEPEKDMEPKKDEVDETEMLRFLMPMTTYNISATEKSIYLSKYELDWINARLMCQSFGMELMAPISVEDSKIITDYLAAQSDMPKNFHVGFTSKGSGKKWYSTINGEVLNFNIGWNPQYTEKENDCMMLQKTDQNWFYQDSRCFDTENNFMCQKFIIPEIVFDYNDEENVVEIDETTSNVSDDTTSNVIDETTPNVIDETTSNVIAASTQATRIEDGNDAR